MVKMREIVCGNCLDEMQKLSDNSIDLIYCDIAEARIKHWGKDESDE